MSEKACGLIGVSVSDSDKEAIGEYIKITREATGDPELHLSNSAVVRSLFRLGWVTWRAARLADKNTHETK